MSASTSTQGSARLKGKADTMRLGVKEPSSAPQPLPPLLRVKPQNSFTTERETGERTQASSHAPMNSNARPGLAKHSG
jgi:hypothetical protein